MGNDGGTKLKRADLVKNKLTKQSENQYLQQQISASLRYQTCQLSGKALVAPIVSDGMGSMYSKEAVLEAIIRKTSKFKSLHNLVELTLDDGRSCISGKELGIKLVKYFYHGECGCVFSGDMAELSKGKCLNCLKEYEDDNIIYLYPKEGSLQWVKQKKRLKALESAGKYHDLSEVKKKQKMGGSKGKVSKVKKEVPSGLAGQKRK